MVGTFSIARLVVALTAIAATSNLASLAKEPRPPNIIYIMADDLGWGDLHCFGNTRIRTPNLDRLAASGTLYTQFYACGTVCSPSRAGFMTGQFPARLGVHTAIGEPKRNDEFKISNWLNPRIPNIASTLKRAGYATGHFGKWHLGVSTMGPSPTAYGIDDHRCWNGITGTQGWKMPAADFWPDSNRLIADETIRFIKENKNKPFFVNVWPLIPHAPLNPTDEQMKVYEHLDWGRGINHRNAQTIYFASVTDLDTHVGRIMATLKSLGLTENTLVLFTSDNGPELMSQTSAGHAAAGSAGPFRGRKRSLYEGGIRVPLIAAFPGVIPAGRIDNDSVVAGADLFPTFCKLASIDCPDADKIDGEDISDILKGQSRPRSKPFFWEYRFNNGGEVFHQSPMLAMRDGNWKLLMNPDDTRVELYDIPNDPTELTNVALEKQEIVQRMKKQLMAWKATLPDGPNDVTAGRKEYPWPGTNPARKAPAKD
jgi:arylsulfatase A-like enzyme